ncbi:3'-5' exonuclease [Aureivirga marina]|uniref:3'-5' exonuclease n=1 Tax=Aureivirga marina TaxID=1182451 RepID=UPI0018CA6115|nr:3'-5' exonuclease [Aureivirga marina]
MLKKITLTGEQKQILFLPPKNPIQIKGVAGSGKTTVALYRAKHLLETQQNLFNKAKVIIFTFNKTLAEYINAVKPYINGGYQKDSDELIKRSPIGLDIQVINFHSWAFKFLNLPFGKTLFQNQQIDIIKEILLSLNYLNSNILKKSPEFFQEEISWMKGKVFLNKSEYIESSRVGRGTTDRVTKKDKEFVWIVYEKYNSILKAKGNYDFDDYALLALKKINSISNFQKPFTHIIIDEAQDLNKAQILTISKLVSSETNSLSIIADAAQRIYKSGFTWKEVGLELRGRSKSFKKNYRNTIEIAKAANSLLDKEEDREDFTEIEYSYRKGKKPILGVFSTYDEQFEYLESQLTDLKEKDDLNSTVILHRNNKGVNQLRYFLNQNGFPTELIKSKDGVDYNSTNIKLCTMSSIKGLEFNNVFITDLNDDIIPSNEGFIDDNDEFHISTERRLLYTCMTRAKNKLFLLSSNILNFSRYLDEIDEDLIDNISITQNI